MGGRYKLQLYKVMSGARPFDSHLLAVGMEEDDEFETVHHAKPKFKPLPRQACQQDSRLVARVCDLARRGLTLAQIDADLREEGVLSMALRPPSVRLINALLLLCRVH